MPDDIKDQILRAAPGGTVTLGPHDFLQKECLEIDHPITVEGAGRRTWIASRSTPVIRITSRGVVLRRLMIEALEGPHATAVEAQVGTAPLLDEVEVRGDCLGVPVGNLRPPGGDAVVIAAAPAIVFPSLSPNAGNPAGVDTPTPARHSPPAVPRPSVAPAAVMGPNGRRGRVFALWLAGIPLGLCILSGAAVWALLRGNAVVSGNSYACVEPLTRARCRAGWTLRDGQTVRVLEEISSAWVRIRWREPSSWKVRTGFVFRVAIVPDADLDVELSPVAVVTEDAIALPDQNGKNGGTTLQAGAQLPIRGVGFTTICVLTAAGRELVLPRTRVRLTGTHKRQKQVGGCAAGTVQPDGCSNATISGHLQRRQVRVRSCVDCPGVFDVGDGTRICVISRAERGFYEVRGMGTLEGKRGYVYAGYVRLDHAVVPAGGAWVAVVPAGASALVYGEEALRTVVLNLTSDHDPRVADEVGGRPDLWALYQPTGVLGYVRRSDVRSVW